MGVSIKHCSKSVKVCVGQNLWIDYKIHLVSFRVLFLSRFLTPIPWRCVHSASHNLYILLLKSYFRNLKAKKFRPHNLFQEFKWWNKLRLIFPCVGQHDAKAVFPLSFVFLPPLPACPLICLVKSHYLLIHVLLKRLLPGIIFISTSIGENSHSVCLRSCEQRSAIPSTDSECSQDEKLVNIWWRSHAALVGCRCKHKV